MNILVTGSTRGIGKVIADELCNIGNVFRTGRNEEILKASKYSDYCVCDLANNVEKLVEFMKEFEAKNA